MANETINKNKELKETQDNQTANDKGTASTDLLCLFCL